MIAQAGGGLRDGEPGQNEDGFTGARGVDFEVVEFDAGVGDFEVER